MKNFKFKKKLLPVLLIVFIIFLGYLNFHRETQDNKVGNFGLDIISQDIKGKDTETITKKQTKPEIKNDEAGNFITLNVLGKDYKTVFTEGDSVFDVMNTIKSNRENDFDFKYKEYPSLGVFISEINGVGGDSNKYWIYYVNGKEAEVGISKYILKSGDIINWNQES